jgi:hypothetical protein
MVRYLHIHWMYKYRFCEASEITAFPFALWFQQKNLNFTIFQPRIVMYLCNKNQQNAPFFINVLI